MCTTVGGGARIRSGGLGKTRHSIIRFYSLPLIDHSDCFDAGWSFTSNGLTLYIEDKHYQYSKFKNGNVVFGIRPEDIHGDISSEFKDERNIINADVEFFEYLGSETNLHLSSGSNRFSAKLNKRIDVDLSQTKVAFDVNKGHLFDAENEDIL